MVIEVIVVDFYNLRQLKRAVKVTYRHYATRERTADRNHEKF